MRFISLHVLYALLLPDLYFWLKLCVLHSNFYGNVLCYTNSVTALNILAYDVMQCANIYYATENFLTM